MEMHLKVSSRSELLKTAMGGGQTTVWTPKKTSNFSPCKAQENQHNFRIAFFKHENTCEEKAEVFFKVVLDIK